MNRADREKADYLETYAEAQQDARDLWDRMETLQQEMRSAKSAAEGWGKDGSGSGRRSDLSDYITRAEASLQRWARKRTDALDTMENIERAIGGLKDQKERRVMTLHYIDGYTWEQIAERMNYGRGNIFRLRRLALKHIKIK